MNEYRLKEHVDIEQFFGKLVELGTWEDHLTLKVITKDEASGEAISIGKLIKRKGKKAGPKLAQEA